MAEYEAEHGGPLYGIRPDQCCHDRKMLPLRQAVVGYDAWISAIRQDQTADRAAADVVQWDAKFNLVKVNPLLALDEEGRVEVHPEARRAVQPAARPGLSEHRLLALHAGGAAGRGRAGRPLGGDGEEGMRPARDRASGGAGI